MSQDTLRSVPGTLKASPLPPVPSEYPVTKDQWRTLLALADCIIPSVQPSSTARQSTELGVVESVYDTALAKVEAYAVADGEAGLARRYLAQKASDSPSFVENLRRQLTYYVPVDLKQQLTLGLTLLNYRVPALILTGRPTPFADQPVHIQEEILLSWATARLPSLRLLFKCLCLLIKQTWAKTSILLHRVLNYPRVPVHGVTGKSYDYSFLQFTPGTAPEVIETDVVIVGSGCGGGVVAKTLAEAGLKVLVADKSYHWKAEHLPMTEAEGWVNLFYNGGFMTSDDNSTCVIAGQTWGGGGTINWSASLQTQGYVRREWSDAGLPFFTSSEFQECLDSVCDQMGVSADHITHNKNSDVLLEGSRKLGWTAKAVPQNTAGQRHYCGYCSMGCGACEKQGPAVSFLPAAARAGAAFIEGYDVSKVIFETDAQTGEKTATGVEGIWLSRDQYGGTDGNQRTARKVIVKAKRVVISAGTMQSPCILIRSGLTNKHIGKNLKLHPTSIIGSIYDEEIRPWEGGILTSVVSSFENLDGKGHGVKLEATCMLPSMFLAFPVWNGGLDFKLLAPRLKNMTGHISLSRDEGSGSVYIDATDGRSRFRYTPSRKDRAHIMEGLIALARINYISGAREIFTGIPGVPRFVRPDKAKPDCETAGINCPTFNAWLDLVRTRGLNDPDVTFMSAHQMGTCRMGSTPKKGAVDVHGQTWEARGLYVSDASVFPSASGVNPMVTNMAISEWVARNLIKELKSGGTGKARL